MAYQKQQWNRYLIKDPYFVTKAYKFYKKYRPTVIEDMIKDGGTIDTLESKYQKASEVNDQKWSNTYGLYRGKAFVNGIETNTQSQNYNEAIASMKTFIEKRVQWMDQQFNSVQALYSSMGNTVSNQISVAADKDESGTVTATAEVKNSSVSSVVFLVNGKKVLDNNSAYVPVVDGKASVVVDSALLETVAGALNTVEVLAVNGSQSYINDMMNFTTFTAEVENPGPVEPAELTGTVTVKSSRTGKISYPDDKLTVRVADTNNTGTLKYQWYADQAAIAGATKASYVLTTKEIGKKLTVQVTSSVETGKLQGTYTGTIDKKPIQAQKIKLSVKSKKMYAYQTLKLKATVTPSGASKEVKYSSDKKSVATVSKTGKITAKAPGTAKITVQATDGSGVKAVCKITVQKPVIKVSGKFKVKPKKSITLTAKTYGLKGKISWKLDAKGKKLLKLNKTSGSKVKLTAKKKTGSAKLTITCGKKKVTKTIRIKK